MTTEHGPGTAQGTDTAENASGRIPIPGWAEFFAAGLGRVPLVVILRGVAPDAAVSAARTAWDAGVGLVEVTVEREDGLAALEAVIRAAPDGRTVGAGTVTTPERLRLAAEAGAGFAVAPGFDADTVHAADEHGIPFLPGVATPTEAGQALKLGVRTVKAFPASVLTPGWVSALAGPYPELRIIATGGVNASNASAFLHAGALGVGVGSSITTGNALPDLVRTLTSG